MQENNNSRLDASTILLAKARDRATGVHHIGPPLLQTYVVNAWMSDASPTSAHSFRNGSDVTF